MTSDYFIRLAFSIVATTYGWGETRCGDVGRPAKCATGATTASGVTFDTRVPQLAVAAPDEIYIPARIIWVTAGGECVAVWLVDKMHPRWIGTRGFDVNPEALRQLVGDDAGPQWSGRLAACGPDAGLNRRPHTPSPLRPIQ